MSSWDEYYALLSRAVTGLDRDAYAARGAVYDREHKSLLPAAVWPDCYLSDAQIDESNGPSARPSAASSLATNPTSSPLVPRRASHMSWSRPLRRRRFPTLLPSAIRRRNPISRHRNAPPARPTGCSATFHAMSAPEVPARPIVRASAVAAGVVPPEPSPPEAIPDTLDAPSEPDKILSPPRRSVFRRVAGRILLLHSVIVAGTIAYAHMVGQIKLPLADRCCRAAVQAEQRAYIRPRHLCSTASCRTIPTSRTLAR